MVTAIGISLLGSFIIFLVIPAMTYLVVKSGTIGYLRAREKFQTLLTKESTSGKKEID